MDSKNESLKNDQAEENLENKQTEAPDDFQYTKDDFYTTAPYDYLYGLSNFEQQIMLEKLAAYAKDKGVGNLKTLWASYKKGKESEYNKSDDSENNVLVIEGIDTNLNCGKWHVTEEGIFLHDELVCRHPIIPYEIIKDIDDGTESYRLLYWLNQTEGPLSQREIVVPADTLFNAKNIVSLADIGIGIVSGKNAQLMAQYFRDLVDFNRPQLKHTSSVSHLGWSKCHTFTPYNENIKFNCADESFNQMCKDFHECGDYDVWLTEAESCMKNSIEVRLVMDASIASVFIEPLRCLPFFLHLWGANSSGSGKTVGAMLAASFWGNPSLTGSYVQTFDATRVGSEVIANFLYSLPQFIDELQLRKTDKYNQDFNVYHLSTGKGRTRSNKELGIRRQERWCNCFITTGETPIVKESDGEGALNRVIEIEVPAGKKIIKDGNHTSSVISENYGLAGPRLINSIVNEGGELSKTIMADLSKKYKEYFNQFMANKVTSKQAMAAALLMIGDLMGCQYIFTDKDIQPLTALQILPFLKASTDVDITVRGYDYICGWINKNSWHFLMTADDKKNDEDKAQDETQGETQDEAENESESENEFEGRFRYELRGDCYGEINEKSGFAYINKNIWEEACSEGGFDPKGLLSALAAKGKAFRRSDGHTFYVDKRINGSIRPIKCVRLSLREKEKQDNTSNIFLLDNNQ